MTNEYITYFNQRRISDFLSHVSLHLEDFVEKIIIFFQGFSGRLSRGFSDEGGGYL